MTPLPWQPLAAALVLSCLGAQTAMADVVVQSRALSLGAAQKPGASGNGMAFNGRDELIVGPSDGDLQIVRRMGDTWKRDGNLGRPAGANGATGIATDGKTLVVGYRSSGTAYTWRRDADAWKYEGQLDFPAGGWAGWSTAVDGDVLVVGASAASIDGKSNAGAAYVFVRNGDGWRPLQRLTTQPVAAEASFGSGVAISAGHLFVGARHETDPSAHPGALYMFERVGDQYVERARVQPQDAADAEFGISVAAEGDLVAVGARGYKNDGGGVFLYHRVGTQLQPAKILHLPQSGFWTSYRIGLASGRVVAGSRAGASALFVYGNEDWAGQTVPASGSAVAITSTAMALADNDSKSVSIFNLPEAAPLPPASQPEPPLCTPECGDGQSCVEGTCVVDAMAEPAPKEAEPEAPAENGGMSMSPDPSQPARDDSHDVDEPVPGGAGGQDDQHDQGGAAGTAREDEDDDRAGAGAGCSLGAGRRGGLLWMIGMGVGVALTRRRRSRRRESVGNTLRCNFFRTFLFLQKERFAAGETGNRVQTSGNNRGSILDHYEKWHRFAGDLQKGDSVANKTGAAHRLHGALAERPELCTVGLQALVDDVRPLAAAAKEVIID